MNEMMIALGAACVGYLCGYIAAQMGCEPPTLPTDDAWDPLPPTPYKEETNHE